jgi:L-arabinokinase
MYSDTQDFLYLLKTLNEHSFAPARELFDTKADLIVTRAPGRLDVMGGIADYSGSHVLEFPIAEATFVALQPNDERRLNVVTLLDDEPHHSFFTMSLTDLDGPIEYETAREIFADNWAAYVAGVFLVLMHERNVSFNSGANILISSRVSPGKGVSSSAALEVAVMQAVTSAFDIEIDGREKALLCQRVENLVVGAPCGVMDQMTAVFGERDRLLFMLCQPAELKRMITLPPQLMLWGIDSGIRHAVSGADYGTVRAAASMGTRMIADLKPDFSEDGYLANISPDEFEREYRDRLPEHIKMPTAHPIYENVRVQRFVELLERNEGYQELGELMYEAHQSYTRLGLNSEGTDLIIELVRKEARLFGAKITGGGSGGTVAVLGDQASRSAIERVVANYGQETGHQPYVFSGSSPGALAFGHLRLSLAR